MTEPTHTNLPKAGSASPLAAQLRPLARLAVGRSGADIERLVREARLKARRAGQKLAWNDLVQALRDGRLDRPEPLRWRMAVHEAGHALVHLKVGTGRIVVISIEAEQGGMVRIEPERHVLETEAWTAAQIVVRLAGRAAEDIVFGDPVAGSGGPPESDLAVATDIAMQLEASLGFGRHQPLLHRSMDNRSHMLALDAQLAAGVKMNGWRNATSGRGPSWKPTGMLICGLQTCCCGKGCLREPNWTTRSMSFGSICIAKVATVAQRSCDRTAPRPAIPRLSPSFYAIRCIATCPQLISIYANPIPKRCQAIQDSQPALQNCPAAIQNPEQTLREQSPFAG